MFVKFLISSAIMFIFGSPFSMAVEADEIDQIKERGYLSCGIAKQLLPKGNLISTNPWQNFYIDTCRGVSSAIFGSPDRIKTYFLKKNSMKKINKFDILMNSLVDLPDIKNTEYVFAGALFFHGQTFLSSKKLEFKNIKKLNGARICVLKNSRSETNLYDYFQEQKVSYVPVILPTFSRIISSYLSGECDVMTGDILSLAKLRSSLKNPLKHIFMSSYISRSVVGPYVKKEDIKLVGIVRFTLDFMVSAEVLGISSRNIRSIIRWSKRNVKQAGFIDNVEVLGKKIGLKPSASLAIIKSVGNYGEMFERHSVNSRLWLPRGINFASANGGELTSYLTR